MSRNVKKKNGFTLMEVVIYLALFAVLMSGFLAAAFTLLESNGKDITDSMIEAEGAYLLAKIDWSLANNATRIDPTTLVSSNVQLTNVLFYSAQHEAGTDTGVRFTLSMPSQEGRLVTEDFFGTTTLTQ